MFLGELKKGQYCYKTKKMAGMLNNLRTVPRMQGPFRFRLSLFLDVAVIRAVKDSKLDT